MAQKQNKAPSEKNNLHPRNRHRSRYDFKALIKSCAELAPFVFVNEYQDESINFSDPAAVKALNKALLLHFYGISWWEIPEQYLCPPVPGRADYIHYLADLLAASNNNRLPDGDKIRVLDIGVGANCIYPIIGHQEYGWHFVGSDIDEKAIDAAEQIIINNAAIKKFIQLQYQPEPAEIFRNIIEPGECFDLTLSNPPFHASAQEAAKSNLRKVNNLRSRPANKPALNFGGQHTELWCEGGELQFIRNMIRESRDFASNCFWFTTLVSKQENMPAVYKALQQAKTVQVKTIRMAQGQKTSRFIAWSFLGKNDQNEWRKKRWQ